MEIANIQTYTSSYAVRLIDTGNHLIINTVPYTKDTNSPIPFNNISVIKNNRTIVGHNAVHPQLNSSGDNIIDYEYANASGGYTINKKSTNMIIDNTDPNICYVLPSWASTNASNLDSVIESPTPVYPSIYKITTLSDGTLKKEYKNIAETVSYYSWQGHIYHMTQNDDYVYVLWGDNRVNTYGEQIEVLKIDKNTLNVIKRCYVNMSYLNNASYKNGNSVQSTYENRYYSKYNIQVLYETSNGFIMFIAVRCTNSDGYTTMYYMTRVVFYNFESGEVTDLTIDQGTLENTQMPYGLPTVYNTSSYPGYSLALNSGLYHQWHYIPSKYLETDNEIYGYYYARQYRNYSTYTPALFYMHHSKNDFMTMAMSQIPLVFPEDSEISELPNNTDTYSTSSSSAGYSTYQDHRYIWETMTTNHNGVDYVHLFYKGIYNSPNTTRGIYTFEISEDRSQATFKSFYRAIDGSLQDYMVLNEDRSKIVLLTQTTFHILKFDTISKSWISVHDELTSVKSMIQTAENKLYYLTLDHSIQMLDLNGAVMIDFNFEKQSYNYNNVDIVSYISIWAKDAEGNYCDTNIKLTITGNAVWQENGIQTLETATSSSGPIEIPFVIKGHTAINVGVDAII